jgi:hypothetical protein
MRLNFWPFSLLNSGDDEGMSCYSTSDKELIRQQLKAGNDRTAEAARSRGYKLHSRLAGAGNAPMPMAAKID